MSVTLNGHTYDAVDFYGYSYTQIVASTGLVRFPNSIFTDMLAELSAASSLFGIAPGAAGGYIRSNGSAWVRVQGITTSDLAAGTITTDLLFTDATYDIGKSAATRPRDLFLSRNLTWGNTATGDGSGISNLNASNLASGTVPNARVVGAYTNVTGLGTQAADLLFTDATYDIGKSGLTRPRDVFASRNITAGTSFIGALQKTLTFGTHLTGTSFNNSADVTIATDAASANTVSTLVARDGSGNFSAGTVTASITGHSSLDLALTGGTMSGDLLFTDATYDIGKSGATRPRDGFFSRNLTVGSTITGTTVTGTHTGDGSLLTSLNATNLGSGTVPNARLSGAYTSVTGLGTQAADLLFTDNTYDIGKSGATRPRDLFLSRNLTVGGTITGSIASANTLSPGRNINGVLFDGSANITVAAAAGTLTGTTLAAGVTASSLTSLGTQAADLLFTDATYDIGKSGATRPRDGFFSRNLTVGGTITVSTTGSTIKMPGWTNATLQNSWVQTGSFNTVAYQKDPFGFVRLQGNAIRNGVGATAFTLPAGYRPGAICGFMAYAQDISGNLVPSWIIVNPTGEVSPENNVGYQNRTSFEGISFEQVN